MAHYSSRPPRGEPFSPTSPYTPSSTGSFSSSHPLFSPNTTYESAQGQWNFPSSAPTKGYTGIQQQFEQAPGSLPPRPPKRKIQHRIGHHVQRLWLWETLACILAVGAHLAMIALLGVYDGSRVASWNLPWTLNSNISFMLTIIKGAALIPVAACLGQLKWRRFWTYRGLEEMDMFDEASRGALGSVRLLLHPKYWGFASIGALLTITALTMDTLAQNVVDTRNALEVTGGVAVVPRTNNYNTYNIYTTGNVPGDQLPWPTMVTAISYGMTYTASNFWAGSELLINCATGNCTFAPYQSLVVDGRCRDVTDRLDSSRQDIYQLPNGPFLRKEDGVLNMSSTTTYPDSDLFQDVGPLISNFQAIANPSLETPTAIQCVLYWSVATMQFSNMTNFTFYEEYNTLFTNTSQEARTKYKQNSTIWITPPECYVNGSESDSGKDKQCTNSIGPLAQLGLQNFLTNDVIGMQGEVYKTKNGWSVNNLFANAMYYVTTTSPSNETYESMELTIENVIIMMTQGVRLLPTNVSGVAMAYPANGTVYEYDAFYEIHFYYLGVTHFVVGGSMLFLCITVFLTRCDHPWKTSSLPLLYHGLTARDRDMVAEVPQMVDMKEAADNMKVKMTMTAVGQRLATRDTVASG